MTARPGLALATALLGGLLGCRAGERFEPALLERLDRAAPGDLVPLIVELRLPATTGGAPAEVVTRRRAQVEEAVAPLRDWLVARALWGGAGRSPPQLLWGAGALALSLPREAAWQLAGAPGVVSVRLDAVVLAPRPLLSAAATSPWNLAAIRAPELWAAGVSGAGATVAILDTGVDGGHPDLAPGFRGGAADWFDPYGQHAAPADLDGHGTGVAGLAVGGAASGTPIGVAPGARWIAAKVYDDAGLATLSAMHRALQWAADPDGDPATADRPDAVVLAFSFPSLVGRCWREFEPDLALLRAAGVAVAVAAGNSGAGATEPPANNPGGFPIGATVATGALASFTSRGASACLAGPYPSLLAPGDLVRTSAPVGFGLPSGPYTTVSGTSFAAPQVAGALALLRAARPSASVDELEAALLATAAAVAGSEAGQLDVLAARDRLLAGPWSPLALDDRYEVAGAGLAIAAPGLLGNDTGPAPLASELAVPPEGGALTLHADGSFEYQPRPLFSGEDRFVYLAVTPAGSSPATVTLRVTQPR